VSFGSLEKELQNLLERGSWLTQCVLSHLPPSVTGPSVDQKENGTKAHGTLDIKLIPQ
jgi:hypothetical protein